jgi:hypothetical protein
VKGRAVVVATWIERGAANVALETTNQWARRFDFNRSDKPRISTRLILARHVIDAATACDEPEPKTISRSRIRVKATRLAA